MEQRKKSPSSKSEQQAPAFDNLLKRMLSTPPKPHPKPAKKDAKKKTAE